MKNNLEFNKLHLNLMLRLWSNEIITLQDYYDLLTTIGIQSSNVELPHEKFRQGIWGIFKVQNKETKEGLTTNISKHIISIYLENREGVHHVVSVDISYDMGRVIHKRNSIMKFREMVPNKLLDPILHRVLEINNFFQKNRKFLEGRDIPGQEFIDFLFKNNLSPYIFFRDYFDAANNYSTIFSQGCQHDVLPFSFDIKTARSEKSVFDKAKSQAERSVVKIIFHN